jgi:D-amino-acid dehydrogenase
LMRRHGLERQVLSREQVLAFEPALRAFDGPIAGGTCTPSDESGDAFVFTQALARRCAERGASFLFAHDIAGLEVEGNRLQAVSVVQRVSGEARRLVCDAGVAALGSHTAPFLRPYGVDLKIEPAKGYSATVALRRPEAAPVVSLIDDARKIAVSRLGNRLRVAGTAELAGYDTGIESERSQLRCNALLKRLDSLFPGVADLSQPNFWAGLRPSTPNNVPYIGRSRIDRLWLNAGHGTLGWTHGAGSGRALAELISGVRPDLDFAFSGFA